MSCSLENERMENMVSKSGPAGTVAQNSPYVALSSVGEGRQWDCWSEESQGSMWKSLDWLSQREER